VLHGNATSNVSTPNDMKASHFARLGLLLFANNTRARVLQCMKQQEPIAALPVPCALKIFALAGISVEHATQYIKFDEHPTPASIGGKHWVTEVSQRCRHAVGSHTELADKLTSPALMRELLAVFLAICPQLFDGNEHHRRWTAHWRQQTAEVVSTCAADGALHMQKMVAQRKTGLLGFEPLSTQARQEVEAAEALISSR
jgi:hypothetical protein